MVKQIRGIHHFFHGFPSTFPTVSRFPRAAAKAPEGWRTPRRFADFGCLRERASVLDCGGPPPLFPGARLWQNPAAAHPNTSPPQNLPRPHRVSHAATGLANTVALRFI